MTSATGNNPISDVANPRPTRTTRWSAPLSAHHRSYGVRRIGKQPARDMSEFRLSAAARHLIEVAWRQSPEARTRRFRKTRLALHEGGAFACSGCHVTPYTCVMCNGTRCLCVADGVYRHWKNGVPIPTAFEAAMLEDVSL